MSDSLLTNVRALFGSWSGHRAEPLRRAAAAKLPTHYGEFQIVAYENGHRDKSHVALVHGDLGNGERVLARIHSSCLTGDVLHSVRCDCGDQLDAALGKKKPPLKASATAAAAPAPDPRGRRPRSWRSTDGEARTSSRAPPCAMRRATPRRDGTATWARYGPSTTTPPCPSTRCGRSHSVCSRLPRRSSCRSSQSCPIDSGNRRSRVFRKCSSRSAPS